MSDSKRTQEVTVDGFRYIVAKLPGMRAYRLSGVLLGKIGNGLKVVAGAVGEGKKLGDIDIEAIAPALASFFEHLDPDQMESITRELLSGVQVVINGKMIDLLDVFDDHFQGRAVSAYKLVGQAIKVNFFPFGLGRVEGGTAPLKSANPSATSTTSAGLQSD